MLACFQCAELLNALRDLLVGPEVFVQDDTFSKGSPVDWL